MLENYNKTIEWFLYPKRWWVPHLIFWIFIYLDELLSLVGITLGFDGYLEIFIVFVLDVIVVYINLYILFPLFFLKNKMAAYIGFTVLSIFINCLIGVLINLGFFENFQQIGTSLIGSFIITAPIVAMAVGVKLFKHYMLNQKLLNELETSNLKTELAYLKDQMNPHFLFNSLNNIYVQSRKRPQEAPDSILQLSDLLRYQLYDCSQEKVPLKEEIKYLDNYLKLDALRKTDTSNNIEIIGNPNGHQVAPFLFIPFVENAVKHGAQLDKNTSNKLVIRFEIAPKKVLFQIENPKPPIPVKHEKGGIGLVNVKRRLELLYPNRHNLHIEDLPKKYVVHLSLDVAD